MRKEEYPCPERCFKKTISRVSQFLHPKDPHMKFYKYSTGDFIVRHKPIDKSHFLVKKINMVKKIIKMAKAKQGSI